MHQRWRRVAVVGVLFALLLAPLIQFSGTAGAQDATPVPGAKTWQVLVNNVSPPGENWSFNAFYPDHLQVHAGDTIEFTLAANPVAMHAIQLLEIGMTPMEFYQGFSGGFRQPDLTRPGGWQSTWFGVDPRDACGRPGHDPCLFAITNDIAFGSNSGILVNPPADGGAGNPSYRITIGETVPPGPYYVLDLVTGPTMQGRIDVVAADQPVQSQADVAAAAERQYQADLAWFSGFDRIAYPAEASNPNGTKTWQVSAGAGEEHRSALSVDEFSPSEMVIIAGDTVTWTNNAPGAVAHTVSGFGPDAAALDVYQPGCIASDGSLQTPAAGAFPHDIWNSCPGAEVNNFTDASQPSAPSGDPYTGGPRTSGILLNADYLDSPVADGLPYASSYSVQFPDPGVFTYNCAIHPGMTGTVVVLAKPMPR